MKRLYRVAILVFLNLLAGSLLLRPAAAQSTGGSPLVKLMDASGPLTPAMVSYIERGLTVAQQDGAELVILELNTPGGSITLMSTIIQDLRASTVPVVVYVTPRGAMAASAGTVITLAGQANAMAPETIIGAASPVGSQGENIDTTEEAKTKEAMRATVRTLAANRPPAAISLAEDTIQNATAVSSDEALKIGLTDFIASDVNDLLRQLDGYTLQLQGQPVVLHTQYAVVQEVPHTLVENALQLLTDPNIVFILLSIGIQALLIELSSPGGWVAGFIGVVCLALVVYSFGILPINLFGLIFIVLAFVLFILEVKTHTSGALTITGIVSFVFGALTLFNSARTPGFPAVSVPLVLGMAAFLAASFMVIISFAWRALHAPAVMGRATLIGQQGTVSSSLAPQGSVQLAGELWTAETIDPLDSIPEGARVEVVAVEGLRLKVRKV